MELTAIFTQFHQLLLNFIKSKVNSHQDAEDIVQNVFVKVATGIENLDRKEEYIDTTKGLDGCLKNFVNQLPEDYRDIIIDVEINVFKQKDLTQKYDLAYPSIRSRVQRGREKLKQILLACCHVKWDNRGNILEVQSKSACVSNETSTCKK